MNRLFVKVTTDPKRKGTLLEVRGDRTVGDMLQHILGSMQPRQAGEHQDARDYRLVRLGRPSTILDSDQVFARTGVANGDTLLLQIGSAIFTGAAFFDFTPLGDVQDASVQDLRAPLRLPVGGAEPDLMGTLETGPQEPGAKTDPAFAQSAPATPQTAPFEFDPLDLGFVVPDDTPAREVIQPAPVPGNWKKIDPTDL
jgi:hypothetical protein